MSQTGGPRKPSPHIRDFKGLVKDYNGVGHWSEDGIRERYFGYAASARLAEDGEVISRQYSESEHTWIYPAMESVISLIERGDAAAIEIGIEFLEEDDFFPFGKIMKSNTARALRRTKLTDSQQERVRRRIVAMMLAGNVPHEFHEYKKLLRTVGVDHLWPELDAGVDRDNRYVMRYYNYLKRHQKDVADAGSESPDRSR